MLLVISPAKTLDFETPAHTEQYSQGDFLARSQTLISQLQKLSPDDISALMNWSRPFTPANAKAAVLAFRGDVYTGLNADSFNDDDFNFAQQHLRILSGLYGLLKPLDLIQPYRLEMGTRFENKDGKNLYEFWDNKITSAINKQLTAIDSEVLVNLASNEYFSAVKAKTLKADIITPVFKDFKNGKYKIISFYAKKARGLMAAYIIKQRISDVDQLKAFDSEGYYFCPEQSSAREWVFLRDTPA